jgi:hypothetical protein
MDPEPKGNDSGYDPAAADQPDKPVNQQYIDQVDPEVIEMIKRRRPVAGNDIFKGVCKGGQGVVIAAVKGTENRFQLFPAKLMYGQVIAQVIGIIPVDETILQRMKVKQECEQYDGAGKQVIT